MFAFTGNS